MQGASLRYSSTSRAIRGAAGSLQLVRPRAAFLFGAEWRSSAARRYRRACGVQANMLKGLFGKAAAPAAPAPDSAAALSFKDNAPSWEDLERSVESRRSELGITPPDLLTGPPNAIALRRTFGSTEEPRVKLYRDHATWCPYCHKIVLQLEEKQIPYVVEKINMRCYGDKPAEFTAKVPSGLLPVMEIDGGRPITESALIAQVLEQLFPERPLLPPPSTSYAFDLEPTPKCEQVLEQLFPERPLLPPQGSPERQRAEALLRLERRLFSDWLQWLCSGWGGEANKANFVRTMELVDEELGTAEGPYFLADFSLVDITFAPFLERIAASIAYYKGFIVRGQGRFPNLDRWFEAMESRPAYLGFKSDYYTHCHDLPPQLGGCAMEPAGEPVAAAIDGRDGKSWHLPLPPLSATTLPEPHCPGENPAVDRWEAAAKLVSNRAKVVPFALRGVGQRGPRPVSAPLCDPTAIPGMEYEREVDAAMRHVAHALLEGVEAKQASAAALTAADPSAAAAAAAAGGDAAALLAGGPVIRSLEYVRDRVCVPRDLKYPAARQFRAALNWVIDAVRA